MEALILRTIVPVDEGNFSLVGILDTPINNTLFSALQVAKKGALSPYVVEWAAGPVKSIKKGIATAASKSKVEGVSAHVFRHSAAVWMTEAGVPMEEISNTSVTAT